MMASRRVLAPFQKNQHLPTVVHIGIEILLEHSKPKPHLNFQRVDWTAFTKAAESKIEDIPPLPDKYVEVVHLLLSTATDPYHTASARPTHPAGQWSLKG